MCLRRLVQRTNGTLAFQPAVVVLVNEEGSTFDRVGVQSCVKLQLERARYTPQQHNVSWFALLSIRQRDGQGE